jgi:hypothetical protein
MLKLSHLKGSASGLNCLMGCLRGGATCRGVQSAQRHSGVAQEYEREEKRDVL